MPNRLVNETSPYLLQHADNPVDWYPWGPEALERARNLDLPILLSVGYSACHWCHVMERESFEDPGTAEVLNRDFVPVKVDREERPDLDGIYMKAVQALTGHGGWPLTAFLTPDGKPFYGGTYYPPVPRPGMPSFVQVLTAVSDAWRNRRDDVLRNADGLKTALETSSRQVFAAEEEAGSDAEILEGAVHRLGERFDPAHGGFGNAPKFPQASVLDFLLLYGTRAKGVKATEMASRTLRAMADGGIRDHLGGGFHRYAVDARWLVPHFEKMLYDNALLAGAYLDGWRATGEAEFRRVTVETLDWILADMRHAEGGFFSARDADSEGREGHFYVWSPEEVDMAAPDRAAARLFRRLYDVEPGGNFEGRSILHRPHGLDAIAHAEGISVEELLAALAPVRRALLAVRARRPEPLRDEKILVSWNAFAVEALATASRVLGRDDYVAAARSAADFLLGALRPDGELRHVWTAGRLGVPAFLEDRAALACACLTLHAATFEARWLDEAGTLCDEIVRRHFDEGDDLFFDDPDGGEALVIRPREVTDQATPSGTSLAVEALLRAGHLLGRDDWVEVAGRALDRERAGMARMPAAFGHLLAQLLRRATPPVEVAVMGPVDDPRTSEMRRAAFHGLHPALTLAGADPAAGPIPDIPLFRGRGTVDGAPAAWICRAFTCDAPVTDAAGVREGLGRSTDG